MYLGSGNSHTTVSNYYENDVGQRVGGSCGLTFASGDNVVINGMVGVYGSKQAAGVCAYSDTLDLIGGDLRNFPSGGVWWSFSPPYTVSKIKGVMGVSDLN